MYAIRILARDPNPRPQGTVSVRPARRNRPIRSLVLAAKKGDTSSAALPGNHHDTDSSATDSAGRAAALPLASGKRPLAVSRACVEWAHPHRGPPAEHAD